MTRIFFCPLIFMHLLKPLPHGEDLTQGRFLTGEFKSSFVLGKSCWLHQLLYSKAIGWQKLKSNLLNSSFTLRINFYLLQTFCPHLGSFCVVSSLLCFGQISPMAFFRWFTATSDRNAESCNRIPSNYCLP